MHSNRDLEINRIRARKNHCCYGMGLGIIILDDYGSSICPGARKAADEFMADKSEYIIHLATMQGVIIVDRI